MLRTAILLGAGVLALGVVWWLAIGGPSPMHAPEAPPSSPAPPPAEPTPAPATPLARAPLPPTAAPTPTQPVPAPALPATRKREEEAPVAPSPPPRAEGPIAELKQAFETEPRDSAAADVESTVQRDMRELGLTPSLFTSVLCRATVCRIQLRWQAQRSLQYAMLMTRFVDEFQGHPGIDPVAAADAEGTVPLDVYWRRRK
jgi:type IV secretory pathway VirB10-like protein